MKKYIKVATAFSAMVIAAGHISAQEPANQDRKLDRQVDVSRDYTPDMGRASKLTLSPDMTDTVALRPQFDYSIRPSAWLTGFGVEAINPVKVDASTYDPLYPFYLKVGGGYPAQSLADLYITTVGRGAGSAGFYVNHYGEYGKMDNDLGYKAKSAQSNNRFGAFGQIPVGKRLSLSGELGYDYDMWRRYGQSLSPFIRGAVADELESEKQAYSVPRGKILFGNSFSDLSYLNFRIGVSGYHMSDKQDNAESGISTFFELGKQFGVHTLRLKGSFDGAFGSDNRKGYYDRIFTVGPRYAIAGNALKLEMGADIAYNARSGADDKTYFLPQASLTLDVAGGYFIPFADLESRIVNNGFYSLTKRNPYFNPDAGLPSNTREYDLRAGFKGSISSYFTYRVYAGGGIWKNPMFFYTRYYTGQTQTAMFDAYTEDDMRIFTAGAELDGRVSGSFTIGAAGHYYSYSSLDKLEHASGMPKFEGSLYVRYNYRGKFFARAAMDVIGERKFLEATLDGAGELDDVFYKNRKAAFDISLEMEYFINRGFGIFLLGQNLADNKLYRFNNYPDVGLRINAGIKLLF